MSVACKGLLVSCLLCAYVSNHICDHSLTPTPLPNTNHTPVGINSCFNSSNTPFFLTHSFSPSGTLWLQLVNTYSSFRSRLRNHFFKKKKKQSLQSLSFWIRSSPICEHSNLIFHLFNHLFTQEMFVGYILLKLYSRHWDLLYRALCPNSVELISQRSIVFKKTIFVSSS